MIALVLAGLFAFNPGFDFLLVPKSPFVHEPPVTGVGAVETNPAGLVEPGNWLFAYENLWFTDAKITCLGIKSGALGASLSYVDFGELEFQDETPNDDGGPMVRPFALTAHLAKGVRIDDELWVGMGATYFYQKIYEFSVHNVLLDFGARYAPMKLPFLTFGAVLRHFGLKAKFERVQYKMPTEAVVGVEGTYRLLTLGYAYHNVVTYDPEAPKVEEHRVYLTVRLPNNVTPTVSYQYGRDVDPLAFSIAFTFKGLCFGYTYRLTKYSFDSPHIFGLRLKI